MYYRKFPITLMMATIASVFLTCAPPALADSHAGPRKSASSSAVAIINLVLAPRFKTINITSPTLLNAGRTESKPRLDLCVSSNPDEFMVKAVGRSPDSDLSLGQEYPEPGRRMIIGGRAMEPGQQIPLPSRVKDDTGCAQGHGVKLEVTLPDLPGNSGHQGTLAEGLTLTFEAI